MTPTPMCLASSPAPTHSPSSPVHHPHCQPGRLPTALYHTQSQPGSTPTSLYHAHCQPGSFPTALGHTHCQPGRITTALSNRIRGVSHKATAVKGTRGRGRSQFSVLASASTAQMEPQGGATAGTTAGGSLPAGATEEDARFMRRAVELAQTAIGKTAPNPIVGCVIVKDGKIVGEGFHPKAGEPHAEVSSAIVTILFPGLGMCHCKQWLRSHMQR